MSKKILSRHIQVGDIISYSFNEVPGSKTPEPWIGTVVERRYCEWLSLTCRWKEGISLGVMWDSIGCDIAQDGVFWITPREWETGNYGVVATKARSRKS